jgi:hypothetical protein
VERGRFGFQVADKRRREKRKEKNGKLISRGERERQRSPEKLRERLGALMQSLFSLKIFGYLKSI